MRAAVAFIAFLAMSDPALADHPYAVAGISNPAHVTQFLARLKQAVADDDRAAVAAMVSYPFSNQPPGAPSRTYRNAAALRANYQRVFTPEIKAALAAAKPDNLFTRDQGVMIGQGQIWMGEVNHSMKIITINQSR